MSKSVVEGKHRGPHPNPPPHSASKDARERANAGEGRERAPPWYAEGLPHIWLPYAQMATARPPLAVARTQGSRIVLADGRELIDGIASWWTACHGYNHPHISAAV